MKFIQLFLDSVFSQLVQLFLPIESSGSIAAARPANLTPKSLEPKTPLQVILHSPEKSGSGLSNQFFPKQTQKKGKDQRETMTPLSKFCSNTQHKTLPVVPAALLLCGTRSFRTDNQEFQSGYISGVDLITGIMTIRWYCPRNISPLPKEIKGHVQYTTGRFAELVALYGVGIVDRVVASHRPHVQFRVSIWPPDRHAIGNIIYIASDIHFTPDNSDMMLTYASNLRNNEKKTDQNSVVTTSTKSDTTVKSEDQVSNTFGYDDDSWGCYRSPAVRFPKLEVVLKPETT